MNSIIDDLININILYRKKLNLDKEITFGTEIEFENASYDKVGEALNLSKNLHDWDLVNDGSVDFKYEGKKYGGEVVSPILTDSIDTWKHLRTVCKLIKSNIGFTNEKAGSHIHIGIQIFEENKKYLLNFIKLWISYEHVIYRFAYGERDYPRKLLCEYAAPCAYRLSECLLEINNRKNFSFDDIIDYIYDVSETGICLRYGLYFNSSNHNPKRKDTIEIRCPNGTLNEKIWQNNINFFTKLIAYSASDNFDGEFINKRVQNYKYIYIDDYQNIYFEDAIELANLIFTKEEDKLYFLKQYLKINNENYQKIKQKIIEKQI